MLANVSRPHSSLQLRCLEEALHESHRLIDKAQVLESSERWSGLSPKTYRQILEFRAALRRLEDALRALDRRLTGVRRVID